MTTEREQPTVRRRWPRVLLVAAVAWLLLEIISVGILALLKPLPSGDILRLYRPHPYRVYGLIPGARSGMGRCAINSHGFRGPEITLRKPPATVRIACLGDAMTFGDTVTSDSRTYPAHLERLLRDQYVKGIVRPVQIEAINAGVPGYTSLEALIYFEITLLDYQLDMAVLNVGWNDAQFLACFRDFASDYTHARKVFRIPTVRLWERSALLSLLLPQWRSIANPYRSSPAAELTDLTITDPARLNADEVEMRSCFRPERVGIFARNVRNFIFVARGHGVLPILSTVLYRPEKQDFSAQVVEQINESIRKTAVSLSVPCVDLAREGPKDFEQVGRTVANFVMQQRLVEQAIARQGNGSSP